MDFLETRFEIKALSEKDGAGVFEGYAAVFDNIDTWDDIIRKGATVESIAKSNGTIPILSQHGWGQQIGWNLSAHEDSIGLYVKGELNLEIEEARNQYALAKQAKKVGASMGLSIGYRTQDYKFTTVGESDAKKEVRELLKIDVKEYSFVTFPANEKATVLNVKSMLSSLTNVKKEELVTNPRVLEHLLREVGFSRSISKKVASTAIKLNTKSVDDGLCELDPSEIEDVTLAIQLMNAQLNM